MRKWQFIPALFVGLLVALSIATPVRVKAQLTMTGIGADFGGAAWKPTNSIGTLYYWYKADAQVYTDTSCSVTATNGSLVACVKDQSTNGRDQKQATSNNRPTFVTNVINGLPALEAVAPGALGTNFLAGPIESSNIAQPGLSFVGWVAGANFSASAFQSLVDHGNNNRFIHYITQTNGATSQSFGAYDGVFLGSTYTAAANDQSYTTVVAANNTTTSCLRRNKSDVTTGGACSGNLGTTNFIEGNGTTTNIQLFGAGNGTGANFYIVEAFAISGNSATDISNGEGYLKARMGL